MVPEIQKEVVDQNQFVHVQKYLVKYQVVVYIDYFYFA